MYGLEGKVALVTGAGGENGIGLGSQRDWHWKVLTWLLMT